MAEAVSANEAQAVKLQPKRRRILDPSAIVPVPVYSNKVNSSLQLKPTAAIFAKKETTDDGADDGLLSEFSSQQTAAADITLSDSEEDEAVCVENKQEHKKVEATRCLSPSPPESPVQKQSRHVKKKLNEIDREFRAMSSIISPESRDRTRSRQRQGPPSPTFEEEQNDKDVIIVDPNSASQRLPYSTSVREIPLKIRCRTDVHKIPVLSSTPLRDVVTQLSAILNVPPSRLLLLREDVELPKDSTMSEIGLGIADIIECVVMAAEDKSETKESSSSVITVRLQGKDRNSSQEFSLHRNAPLGPIFSQYLSKMPASAQRKVRFLFDGFKVTHSQTPAQLDMEDGDIIEVWI
uniref:NFATC2-interacting protein n=1 Tax=Monopterus albus TaxID=43700 RepID=UPI0009B2F264|nr:NFATC2-interacting protein [Monopterus albus]